MTTRMIRWIATATPLLAGLIAHQAVAQSPMQQQVTKLAQPYVDSKTVDALSIGVIKGDQTATVHLGKLNEGGGPPNDDTLYEIGSVSKVFTGILLADAVSKGE